MYVKTKNLTSNSDRWAAEDESSDRQENKKPAEPAGGIDTSSPPTIIHGLPEKSSLFLGNVKPGNARPILACVSGPSVCE
jgi:hypothetical protein